MASIATKTFRSDRHMISRTIDQIEFKDIVALVAAGRAEDRRIEFKRELPGGRDEDKKEFLADISSLANADGGDLIFGVEEVDGIAAGTPGIVATDPDAEILRLESLARNGLQPRVTIRTVFVPDPDRPGTGALVMRTPASLQGPHRIIFKNSNRFFTRHSKGKAEMDVDELRQAFTDAEGLLPAIRGLHGTITRVSGVPLIAGPALLISVVPVGLRRRRHNLDPLSLETAARPVWGGSLDYRHLLEGFLVWAPSLSGAYGQTLTYRSGMVESYSVQGSMTRPDAPWVWAENIERDLTRAVASAITVLGRHGVEGPWFVKATLYGVAGRDLHVGDSWVTNATPSARDEYAFSDLVLDDWAEACLAPIFKELWWAFGKERPDGWTPKPSR